MAKPKKKATAQVKSGDNYLLIKLSGQQSYVRIIDENGDMVRHDESPGITELLQGVAAGKKYRIETDGEITECTSQRIDIETE